MITLTCNTRFIVDALSKLKKQLTPAGMRPMMKEIGEVLLASTIDRFATGTAPDGSKWKPNTQATVLAYLSSPDGRGGKRPLVDTGQLSSTIRSQIADGGAAVVIGTDRHFGQQDASVHQFGTNRAGRNHNVTIPARPFLGLSTRDVDTVLDIINREISAV